MSNLLTRLGIDITHFSKEERAAQAQAEAITTKAKALLASPAALVLEEVFPEFAAAAPAVNTLVNKLCITLQNPVIANDLDILAGVLGRYGALLTGAIDNNPHKTIGEYILIFESLFKG